MASLHMDIKVAGRMSVHNLTDLFGYIIRFRFKW